MEMTKYLYVYPEGDYDYIDLLSIELVNIEDFGGNVPRVGTDGDVDTYASVRFPDGSIRTVLTLDIIDLNFEDDDLD